MLGLVSLLFGVLSPFAILSGARSLSRIRASRGALRGAWRAGAGLVAGVISLLAALIGIAYWVIAS